MKMKLDFAFEFPVGSEKKEKKKTHTHTHAQYYISNWHIATMKRAVRTQKNFFEKKIIAIT